MKTHWVWSEWGATVRLVDGGELRATVLLPPLRANVLLLPEDRYLELPREGQASLDLELDWSDFRIDRTISSKALARSLQTRVKGQVDDPWVEAFSGSVSVEVRAESVQLRVVHRDKVTEWDISTLSSLLALPRLLAAALRAAAERHLGLLDPVNPDRALQTYVKAFLGQIPPQVILTDLRDQPELAEIVEKAYQMVVLSKRGEKS